MPRLSTLKAVIPTLMAELTAWSVACPAAAPYLHQKSRLVERSEQGVGKRFGVGEKGGVLINVQCKYCKYIMLYVNQSVRITPMQVQF